jgi:hypothetical protein
MSTVSTVSTTTVLADPHPTLRTVTVVFAPDGLRVQARYVRKDGPNPVTKARVRELRELVRLGLSDALRRLEAGEISVTQEAGFEQRMDTVGTKEVAGG